MKGLENELSKKDASLSELKVQLAESREKEQTTRQTVAQLNEQVCSNKCYRDLVLDLEVHILICQLFFFLGRAPEKYSQ